MNFSFWVLKFVQYLDIVVEHNSEIIQKSEIIFGNKKNFAFNFHSPGIPIVLFPIILEFCIDICTNMST